MHSPAEALKHIKNSAYGGRPYQQLSYVERRFGGCCYTKQIYDTDPLGSKTGDVGRLQTIPNISNQKHHVWNSKESDWWRDILRREGNSKKTNLRTLSDIVRDSKIMYSEATKPRTVLGTEPPTMTEASLRRMQMPIGKRAIADFEATQQSFDRTQGTGRSRSRCDANDILSKHGLELTTDTQRLRLKRPEKPPRIEELESLHMATLMPGPKSSRMNSKLKAYVTRANSALS